jgi:hypothetical protein
MVGTGSNIDIILFIIGIVVIGVVMFFAYKTIYERLRISNLTGDDLKFYNVRRIYKKLKRGETPKATLIKKKAFDLEKRTLIYDVLNTFNKTELFPYELQTLEKSSESYLANWLDNNEYFESFPDEIIYEKMIKLDNGSSVLIFKFKNYSHKEWLIGYVCYGSHKIYPYMKPDFISSEFNKKILSKNELENYKWNK